MRTRQGDLLALAQQGEFDVIVHGCNCLCAMDQGIALQIRQQFAAAWRADLETGLGDRSKLGSFSSARVMTAHGSLVIVNAYTQFDYRGRGQKVDYAAIRGAMQSVAASFRQDRIGYPRIGAGLGGGDWTIISGIIDDALAGLDHTCVVLPE